MSALEQEIYEKFQQLDDSAKQRVLQHLNAGTQPFDWQEWFRRVEAVNAQMRAESGSREPVDVVGQLRQIREDEA